MKNSKTLKALACAALYPIVAAEIAFLIAEIASQVSGRNLLTGSNVWQSSWFLCFISLTLIYLLTSTAALLH